MSSDDRIDELLRLTTKEERRKRYDPKYRAKLEALDATMEELRPEIRRKLAAPPGSSDHETFLADVRISSAEFRIWWFLLTEAKDSPDRFVEKLKKSSPKTLSRVARRRNARPSTKT